MRPFHERLSNQVEELQDKQEEATIASVMWDEAVEQAILEPVEYIDCIKDEIREATEQEGLRNGNYGSAYIATPHYTPATATAAYTASAAASALNEWELKATLAYKLIGLPAYYSQLNAFIFFYR